MERTDNDNGYSKHKKMINEHLEQTEIIHEMYNPKRLILECLTFGLYKRKERKSLQKRFDELHQKIKRG